MDKGNGFLRAGKIRLLGVLGICALVMFARQFYVYGQDKSDFPEGYDAVLAAPDSHKVIFENELVPRPSGHGAGGGQDDSDASPSLAEFLS